MMRQSGPPDGAGEKGRGGEGRIGKGRSQRIDHRIRMDWGCLEWSTSTSVDRYPQAGRPVTPRNPKGSCNPNSETPWGGSSCIS